MFFLTATANSTIVKRKSSTSGAEVGCQKEIGMTACILAGRLAPAVGRSNEQIPCIEQNAFGAMTESHSIP
jgi:L-serine deaminase